MATHKFCRSQLFHREFWVMSGLNESGPEFITSTVHAMRSTLWISNFGSYSMESNGFTDTMGCEFSAKSNPKKYFPNFPRKIRYETSHHQQNSQVKSSRAHVKGGPQRRRSKANPNQSQSKANRWMHNLCAQCSDENQFKIDSRPVNCLLIAFLRLKIAQQQFCSTSVKFTEDTFRWKLSGGELSGESAIGESNHSTSEDDPAFW